MNIKMTQHAAPLARSCAPDTPRLVVDGEGLAYCTAESVAIAEEIAGVVNAHNGLVEALKQILAARDFNAEHGRYPPGSLNADQAFDDWAADLASSALAGISTAHWRDRFERLEEAQGWGPDSVRTLALDFIEANALGPAFADQAGEVAAFENGCGVVAT